MMHPKINFKYLFILLVVSVFLLIYPWTKEVKVFRAKDLTWKILKSSVKTNQFDVKTFTFYGKYQLNEEINKLNGREIKIKGFFKKEKHGDETDYILTETVTNVCFACDHDEHYNLIQLFPNFDEINIFNNIKDDTMIEVYGNFEINRNKKFHSVFLLKNVFLTKQLN